MSPTSWTIVVHFLKSFAAKATSYVFIRVREMKKVVGQFCIAKKKKSQSVRIASLIEHKFVFHFGWKKSLSHQTKVC